jgi:hypothetical protein
MFYVRINKIKVFNNREGILGLFNRAELRIYSHVAGYSVGTDMKAGSATRFRCAHTMISR